MRHVRSLFAAASVIVAPVVATGCGATTVTPRISVIPPSAAAITGGPNLTAAPVPAGWQIVAWPDPPMRLALPSDWTAQTLPEPTGPDSDPSLPQARVGANGDIATPQGAPINTGLSVFVWRFSGSLDAFGDHYEANLKGPGVGADTVDRETIVLPAGTAVRLSASGSTVGVPWYEVAYLLRLPDGRSLQVSLTPVDKVTSQSAVDAFAAQVIATLAPAP